MSRVICWFSCGAASAVATKLALETYGDRCVVASIDTGSEHPDNERFKEDCAKHFGVEILTLKSDKYDDIWDVFEKTRYLVGPTGARCTGELKKAVRRKFERPDDLQVFGYTADEAARRERFMKSEPGIDIVTPLIDAGLTKADCFDLVRSWGIELPEIYRMGYTNANCIGCVKGGMGYWNKIRVDFPDVFERMAQVEEDLGRTVIRVKGEPLPLRKLEPGRGRYGDENMTCGFTCEPNPAQSLFDPEEGA